VYFLCHVEDSFLEKSIKVRKILRKYKTVLNILNKVIFQCYLHVFDLNFAVKTKRASLINSQNNL